MPSAELLVMWGQCRTSAKDYHLDMRLLLSILDSHYAPAMPNETPRRVETPGDPTAELTRAINRAELAEIRAQRAELRVQHLEHELAEARDADRRRLVFFQLWLRAMEGVRWAVPILAVSVPVWALEPIARDFAGQTTHLDATVSISIAFSLAVSVAWAVSARQSHIRKKKIKTQRDRLTELERELEDLRRRLPLQREGE